MQQLGQSALAQAIAANQPAIVLAGHSYNAFTPEGSQSVGKKLSSMGVAAIPADCLIAAGAGPTSWHFANQVMNAVNVVKQHPNLFLLCVSNFSCTIDAFTQSMLASEMGSKPYLILEIDAHTADAGVQTRLEAFLDIVRNFRAGQSGRAERFNPARLIAGGQLIPWQWRASRAHRPAGQALFPQLFAVPLGSSGDVGGLVGLARGRGDAA